LQSAFVAPDQANYVAGKNFNDDVAMFLNPTAFLAGNGTGSAYLAEAYLMGWHLRDCIRFRIIGGSSPRYACAIPEILSRSFVVRDDTA